MKVHFTITGFLTTFCEEVPDNMTRSEIVAELNQRIKDAGYMLAHVNNIFFIDHARPVDQTP